MKHIKIVFFILTSLVFQGCANDFMGAKMVNYVGWIYVERWYLNPEYDKSDIPSGAAFYGAAAEKVKDRFVVRYYIYDGKKSDVEIPESDMWIVNHNGKRWNEQDDNDFYFYKKIDFGEYEKYLTERNKAPLTIIDGRLIPIVSCDDNSWCKVYPNFYSNDLYVKRIILKEPLKKE